MRKLTRELKEALTEIGVLNDRLEASSEAEVAWGEALEGAEEEVARLTERLKKEAGLNERLSEVVPTLTLRQSPMYAVGVMVMYGSDSYPMMDTKPAGGHAWWTRKNNAVVPTLTLRPSVSRTLLVIVYSLQYCPNYGVLLTLSRPLLLRSYLL